jgi:methylase of polypeptide subunit release factors
MEIGADQEKAVSDIFAGTAAYESMEIYNDYSGLPRVFQARKR